MPDRRILFHRALNQMSAQADAFAELCYVTMGHVGHTWQGHVPTKEDCYRRLLDLISSLKFDVNQTYYVAATGGIHVELVFWPKSSPIARIYYSPLTTAVTFNTD